MHSLTMQSQAPNFLKYTFFWHVCVMNYPFLQALLRLISFLLSFSFLFFLFWITPKSAIFPFPFLTSQRKRNHVWLHWILKNQEGGLIYTASKKSKSEICGPWFVHHLWLPTYLPGLVDISRSNICSIYVASRFVYNRVDFLLLFLVSFFWSCRNFCYC